MLECGAEITETQRLDRRDVATITFKAMALWPIVTGLTQAASSVDETVTDLLD